MDLDEPTLSSIDAQCANMYEEDIRTLTICSNEFMYGHSSGGRCNINGFDITRLFMVLSPIGSVCSHQKFCEEFEIVVIHDYWYYFAVLSLCAKPVFP